MAAEIEFYDFKINSEYPVDGLIAKPGGIEISNFFGESIGILAACDVADWTGTVTLIGHDFEKRIEVKVFENEADEDGEKVNLEEGQITIIRPQELRISLLENEKIVKEADVFLWSDEDEPEEDLIPDDSDRLVKV